MNLCQPTEKADGLQFEGECHDNMPINWPKLSYQKSLHIISDAKSNLRYPKQNVFLFSVQKVFPRTARQNTSTTNVVISLKNRKKRGKVPKLFEKNRNAIIVIY